MMKKFLCILLLFIVGCSGMSQDEHGVPKYNGQYIKRNYEDMPSRRGEDPYYKFFKRTIFMKKEYPELEQNADRIAQEMIPKLKLKIKHVVDYIGAEDAYIVYSQLYAGTNWQRMPNLFMIDIETHREDNLMITQTDIETKIKENEKSFLEFSKNGKYAIAEQLACFYRYMRLYEEFSKFKIEYRRLNRGSISNYTKETILE